ncbi:MAG: sugar-binding transcriptional regulator [Alphaproteobacteria bacterium]
MAQRSNAAMWDDGTASIATRAAWLHFAGGMTQAEVAQRLGISSLKAHRLISRASKEGLIRVYVDGEIAECIQLEEALCARYRLESCQVVPTLDDEPLPLRALGMAGAEFLRLALQREEYAVIGVGHGRTLAAAVEHLPRMPAGGTSFVSLLGGLTRKFAANPYDVIHRLAERTGAEAYVMPVPFVANSVEDRRVLMAQRGISEVFDLASRAGLMLVGIGTVEPEASLISTRTIERAEMDDVKAAGGCGELLGHFYDAAGAPVRSHLSDRTLSVPPEQISGRRLVAIAGGTAKVPAIRSILSSGLLGGLITDERTAAALVSPTPGSPQDGRH